MVMMVTYSVAKDSSSPLVLKLTLHSLMSCWEPDINSLTTDRSAAAHSATDHSAGSGNTAAHIMVRPDITQLISNDSETQFDSLSLSVFVSLCNCI